MVTSTIALLAAESYFLLPHLGGVGTAFSAARPWWLVVAVAVEISSMMSFARLQRVMLKTGGVQVRLRDAVATVLVGNSLSVALPGGSLLSFAYTARRMRTWGASAPLAAFSLATAGILSTAALTLIAAAGGALADRGSHPLPVIAEVTAVVALVCLFIWCLSHPRFLTAVSGRAVSTWLRLRPSSALPHKLDRALAELTEIHPRPRVWLSGFAFAFVNWVNDLLCLFAACYSAHTSPRVGVVFLAYAAGMAAASSIPFLPGGIGVVEPAIILTLHHGGVPLANATAAVLVYRAISTGLVCLAGGAVLLSSMRKRQPAGDASNDLVPRRIKRNQPQKGKPLGNVGALVVPQKHKCAGEPGPRRG